MPGCEWNIAIDKPSTVTPTDFRFYISAIALIDANGNAVPLTLEQDGKWQYQDIALLDFEDKSAACANGTVETRNQVIGTVPPGEYRGLQFTLGIPSDLNHEDATLAPSPLNLTSLWWNWRGGYKFVRIDLDNQNTALKHEPHDQGQDQAQSQSFLLHIGSTGCKPLPIASNLQAVANPTGLRLFLIPLTPHKMLWLPT